MVKNWHIFNESLDSESILKELSWELVDSGLSVTFPNDNKFGGKFYMSVYDEDKVFCKEYPENDMDWLYNKPIMLKFYKHLDEIGIKRDIDYKLYGGGLGVNLVFDDVDKIVNWFNKEDNDNKKI